MKKILSCLLTMVMLLSLALPVNYSKAAEPGATFDTAVEVSFGVSYTKSWNKDTDHLNHYVKFVVPVRGIVTINATKPFDSEGEYGKLEFVVYNAEGEAIWENKTYHSVDSAKSSYEKRVGLNPGIYYMTLKPGFYVTSGTIDTIYTLNFEENEYVEAEDNGSVVLANEIEFSKTYTTFIGGDGYPNKDDADYFKFRTVKGSDYRLYFENYNVFESYTLFAYVIEGEKHHIAYIEARYHVDENGYNYFQFKASNTGYAYIHFDDSGCANMPIKFRVCEFDLNPPTKPWINAGSYGTGVMTIWWNEVVGANKIEIAFQKVNSRYWSKMVIDACTSRRLYRLVSGTRYNVCIRGIKEINGKKIYGPWSNTRTVKIK